MQLVLRFFERLHVEFGIFETHDRKRVNHQVLLKYFTASLTAARDHNLQITMSEFCLIKKGVPVSNFTQSCLTEYEISDDEQRNEVTIGGILSNCKHAWYANGPRFQVIELKTGKTIAAWTFGSVVKDPTTKVICVTEIPVGSRETPLLVVGLECVLTGGMICVFDLLTSRVLRAVQLKDKVTSVHVINSGSSLLPVHGPLRSFDGVIGVGSLGGNVLLVDLCKHLIDEAEIKDEVEACQVIPIAFKDLGSVEYHKHTLQSGKHLAIFLNVDTSNKSPRFALKGPEGDTRIHVNKLEVAVSSLCYCPQLGSLLVGYNFGAWQIWELFNMSLVYTSPVYEENTPISHFAVQEPMDDPKPFCYVWTVYSHTEPYHSGFPIAVMYSLSYDAKEYHDGYGYLYQDFQSCSVRFQTELASMTHDHHFKGANCIRLTSYNRNHNKGNHMDHHDDYFTIASMAWNVWGPETVETYLSVFDLDQWYKAQMPSSPDSNCDSYISFIRVTDLMALNHISLDVAIDESSVRQFLGVQKPEEHYYPTALSYDFIACNDKVNSFLHHQGRQRSFLSNLKNTESLIMLKPAEACHRAVNLGLTPLFLDATLSSITCQREFLFNLALENQMTGWLCNCVTVWSNGSFVSTGCSLESFLEWAWNRACSLKSNADSLCIPLFDCSETILDSNSQKMLIVCLGQLTNLLTIYKYICKKLSNFIQCKEIIQQQCNSLQVAVTHLDITQWLVNTGLLPESNQSNLYPIETLLTYYDERRATLQAAIKERFSSNEPLLFIDNLLANEFSDTALQDFWKLDDGNGLYPPSSVQSLLRTYLIEDVPVLHKHSLVIYAFLDLAMALDKKRFTFIITQLVKFPTIFQVSPSTIKLTQAFWHLDHGDYGPALERLLDPQITNADLKLWHHRIVLNSFLIQGQYNSALTYYQIRKPCLKEEQDIKNIVSLYIENRMLHESLAYIRNHSNSANREKLLMHFYSECNSTKQIKLLIRFSLSHEEEQVLMKYLKQIAHPDKDEYEIIYYLQRFRYMDIFKMSEKHEKVVPSGLVGQKNMNFKENIVRTLHSFFPKVTQDLYKMCQNQKDTLAHKVLSRPTPMSVFVHNSEEQAKYKSSLILAGIMKAKETWTHPILGDDSTVEEMPFVRTPVAPRATPRKRPAVVCPIVTRADGAHIDETSGESPCKRRRLSARESLGFTPRGKSLAESTMNLSPRMMKLETPIVKRQHSSIRDGTPPVIRTPQSILKIRNSTRSLASESVGNTTERSVLYSTSEVKKLGFGLSPRKSLPRTSVHFESSNEASQLSGFLNISSISHTDNTLDKAHDHARDNAQTESVGSKDKSGDSTDDVYYSPEGSLSDHQRPSTSFEKEKSRVTRTSDIMSTSVQEDKEDFTVASSNFSVASPNISVASPNFTVASKLERETEEVSVMVELPPTAVRRRDFSVKGRGAFSPVKKSGEVSRQDDDDDMSLSLKSPLVGKERSFDDAVGEQSLSSVGNASISAERVEGRDESVLEESPIGRKRDFNVSVKGRGSYKDPSPESSASKDLTNRPASPIIFSPAKTVKEKVRARKSLSRMVLEHNAFAASSPRTRRSTTSSVTTPKIATPSPKIATPSPKIAAPSPRKSDIKDISSISDANSTFSTLTDMSKYEMSLSFSFTYDKSVEGGVDKGEGNAKEQEPNELSPPSTPTKESSPSKPTKKPSPPSSPSRRSSLRIAGRKSTLETPRKLPLVIEVPPTPITPKVPPVIEASSTPSTSRLMEASQVCQTNTSTLYTDDGDETDISWSNLTTSLASYSGDSIFTKSMLTYDTSTKEVKENDVADDTDKKIEEDVEFTTARDEEEKSVDEEAGVDDIHEGRVVKPLEDERIEKTVEEQSVREESVVGKKTEESFEEVEIVEEKVVIEDDAAFPGEDLDVEMIEIDATKDDDVVHIDDSKEDVEEPSGAGSILVLSGNEFELNISNYSSANTSKCEGPITKEMLAQSLLELNIPNPTLDYTLPDVTMDTEESPAEREVRELNVAYLTNYSSLEESTSNAASPRQLEVTTIPEEPHSVRFDETINLNTAAAEWHSDNVIEISDSSSNDEHDENKDVSSRSSSSNGSNNSEDQESEESSKVDEGNTAVLDLRFSEEDTIENSVSSVESSEEMEEKMEEDVVFVEDGNASEEADESLVEIHGEEEQVLEEMEDCKAGERQVPERTDEEVEDLEEYAKQILDEELEDQESGELPQAVEGNEKDSEDVRNLEETSCNGRMPEEGEKFSQNIRKEEQPEESVQDMEEMSSSNKILKETEKYPENTIRKEECSTNLKDIEETSNLPEEGEKLSEDIRKEEQPEEMVHDVEEMSSNNKILRGSEKSPENTITKEECSRNFEEIEETSNLPEEGEKLSEDIRKEEKQPEEMVQDVEEMSSNNKILKESEKSLENTIREEKCSSNLEEIKETSCDGKLMEEGEKSSGDITRKEEEQKQEVRDLEELEEMSNSKISEGISDNLSKNNIKKSEQKECGTILEEMETSDVKILEEVVETPCGAKIPEESNKLSENTIRTEAQQEESGKNLEEETDGTKSKIPEETPNIIEEPKQTEESDSRMEGGQQTIKVENFDNSIDVIEKLHPKSKPKAVVKTKAPTVEENPDESIDITEKQFAKTTRISTTKGDILEKTPARPKTKPIPIHKQDIVELSPKHWEENLRRSSTARKRSASCDQPPVVRQGRQRSGSVNLEIPSTSLEVTTRRVTRASSESKEESRTPQKRTRRVASASEIITSNVTESVKSPARRSKRTASITANLPTISEELTKAGARGAKQAIKDEEVKEDKVATPTRSLRRRSMAKTDCMEEKKEEKAPSPVSTRGRRKKVEEPKEELSEQETSPSSTTGSISGRLRTRRLSTGSTSSVESMASRRRRSTSVEDTAPATPKKKGNLAKIYEEPEKESEEPKKKKGRPRKGSST